MKRKESTPRKTDARERLRRVLFLVPFAVRHPGIPVRELAERCGVTEKQILDDLDFLLGVGCPPFAPDDFLDVYVEGDRVYVALHQSFSRPPRFTHSEAAALAAAASALGGEGKDRAVRALRESIPEHGRQSFDELVTHIYAGSPPAKDSILGRLERAVAERRAVRLSIFLAPDGEEERTAYPLTLAQRFGHWYLFAHDPESARSCSFRLDRIRDCTLTDVRFEPPPEAELVRARLFPEASGEPIRIRLGPLAAAWALARPGQIRQLKRARDGGATVEVAGVEHEWATRFALSFGGDAEVLSPTPARRHFVEAVRRTLGRYSRYESGKGRRRSAIAPSI